MTTTPSHFSKDDYEIVKHELLYQGVFKLSRYHLRHRLFKGGWSPVFKRELHERASAAAVLPYDPLLDRVILIEQFRPGSFANPKGPWLMEIPAGIITHNATPEEVAHHEAEEEAGCTLLDLTFICDFFVSPGGSNEFLTLYCGRVDASHTEGIHGLPTENEDIRVHNLTVDEAIEKLNAGEIKTSPAIMSLWWLQLNKERIKSEWGKK